MPPRISDWNIVKEVIQDDRTVREVLGELGVDVNIPYGIPYAELDKTIRKKRKYKKRVKKEVNKKTKMDLLFE